ncbi:MAG: nuclear transport factor 2 family protein [Novosphingobium sp.]|nr:nuclear transport factor 2 family protein [Novosphingobium sp.]MCP5403156.1 nuclear transport factor 2 family protein [Novosphingobium sp.]
MTELDPRLQEMLDHHEIRKVLAEYCHACDRADGAMMAGCYTGDDSFDDHGTVKASGPEYVRVMMDRIVERTEAMAHILGQSLIDVDGDKACAETFFIGFFRLPGGEKEPPVMNQLVGRFVDRLERIGGQWKIRHRTCVRDTSTTAPITRDDYAGFGFVEGTRDSKDPGAALLELAHHP